MRPYYRFILTLTVILFGSFSVFADSIYLKNGDRISGSILRADNKSLVIKTEFAGAITIQMDAIDKVVTDKTLHITSKEGQAFAGKVQFQGQNFQIQTAYSGAFTLTRDKISTIRSEEEQANYLNELYRQAHPRFTDLWSGSTDFGISLSRGNADVTTFTTGLNASRKTADNKLTTYFNMLKSRGKFNGQAKIAADSNRTGIRYESNLTPRIFSFASADAENNKLQRLNLRVVSSGGFGLKVLKNGATNFDMFLGGAFNQERFENGIRRKSAELNISEESFHKIASRTSFKQKATIFPNLKDGGEYRFAFDSTIVTSLTRVISWQVTLSNRYISNPPLVTLKKNDVLMTTGLRVNLIKGK
ncbi:MAG: DUF481 domain-containing protein [Acidobacteriota bacterium]